MGVFIRGLFTEYNKFTREQDGAMKTVFSVSIACGRYVYTVYMDSVDVDLLSALSVGDPVQVTCRPYVNKQGRLSWAGGTELVSI